MHPISLEPQPRLLRSIRNTKQKAIRNEAFQLLLFAWDPVVIGMAKRYAPRSADRPDFEQVGRLAILRAAERFRPCRGNRFENYGRRAIRNAILDQLRPRRQRELVVTFRIAFPEKHDEEDGLSLAIRKEIQVAVRRTCRRLDRRLRTIVEGIFFRGDSQVDLARHFQITPARVNQLLKRFHEIGRRELRGLIDP